MAPCTAFQFQIICDDVARWVAVTGGTGLELVVWFRVEETEWPQLL